MYELNGQQYSLEEIQAAADQSNLSLQEYIAKANIKMLDPVGPDFQLPTTPGAVVESTVAPDMDSTSDPGSSGFLNKIVDSPIVGKFVEQIVPRTLRPLIPEGSIAEKGQDLLKTGVTAAGITQGVKEDPKSIAKSIAGGLVGAAGFLTELVPSVVDYAERLAPIATSSGRRELLAKTLYQAGIKAEDDPRTLAGIFEENLLKQGEGIDFSPIYDAADNLYRKKDLISGTFDEEGNKLGVTELLEKGEYSKAATSAVADAITSAPSLALSYAFPVAGSAILGASVAGREFEDRLKEGEQGLANIYLGSTLYGVAEFGTEFAGAKILRAINGARAAGVADDAVKAFTKEGAEKYVSFLAGASGKFGLGFAGEGFTEAVTQAGQMATDALVYDNDFDFARDWRQLTDAFIVGGLLGGPVTGATDFANRVKLSDKKELVYNFIAPKAQQSELNNIRREIAALNQRKSKYKQQARINQINQEIQKQENVLKTAEDILNNRFDNLTKKEIKKYYENNKFIRNNIYDTKNGKFTESEKQSILKEINEKAKENEQILGSGIYNGDLEIAIAEGLADTEIVLNRFDKLKGVNKEDLDIIKITDPKKRPKEMNDAAGLFLDGKGKKPVIYIDVNNAVDQGSTSVLGHELLHYVFSRAFKTDNQSMAPLVNSFKEYLKKSEEGTNILNRIEQRIKSEPAYFDANKNEFKEGALEEYFTIFSEIISTEKVNLDETKINGITRSLKNTFDRLVGASNVQLNSGKDIVNFLKNYNNNVNRNNKLLKYTLNTTIDGVKIADNKQTINKQSINKVKINEGELSEIIDSYPGSNTIQTNADFVQKGGLQSIKLNIQDLGTLDGYLTNLILEDGKIPQEQIPQALKKVKDRLLERIEKNYQPIKDGNRRSLFSYIFGSAASRGKGGIAFRSLQDIKAEVAKAPKTISVQKQTAEGTEEIQIADDAGIENFVDRSLSEDIDTGVSSALQNNLTVNGKRILDTDSELAQVIRDTALDIQQELQELGLDPQDSKYRKEYTKIVKNRSKDALKKFRKALDISTKQKYEKFLREIFNKVINNPKALNISYFVQAERENANKIFVKKNRRLTTQKDIRKAVENGLAFVENEADGVMLYDKLRTTPAQGLSFFLDGERIDGKKTALVTAMFMQAVSDATPGVLDKAGFNEGQKNTVLRKIQRVANQKFSKSKKKTEYEISKIINSLEFQEVLQNHIGIITDSADIKEKIDAFITGLNVLSRKYPNFDPADFMKNKSGQTAEYFFAQDLINKVYPGANIENIGELKELTTGDTGVDVILKTPTGARIGFEVKMNSKAIMGSFTIGNIGVTEGLLAPGDQTLALSIAETLLQNNIIPALKKQGFKESDLIIENGQIKFPKEKNGKDVLNIVNKSLKEAELNKTDYILLEDGGNLIAQFYINKGKNKGIDLDYIYMYDVGLLHLDKNTLHIPNTKHISEVIKGTKVAITWKSTDSKSIPKGKNEIYRTLTATVQLNTLGKPKSQSVKIENIKNVKKFSKSKSKLNKIFNEYLEKSTGIGAQKVFSEAKAIARGKQTRKVFGDYFIPPGAEDFGGLMHRTLAKGKVGEEQLKFYKKHLYDTFNAANESITRERRALTDDFRALKKKLSNVPKKLKKLTSEGDFTTSNAIRVYIWNKQGMKIPGLSETDLKSLINEVQNDSELLDFSNQIIRITKAEGYAKPENNWLSGNIATDLMALFNTSKRSKHLEVWQNNVDQIFTKENLNKLEAAYGKNYRVNLERTLERMKTGMNRKWGGDKTIQAYLDWVNGSVGAIMFLNTRSAVLQTISNINYINFKDNNPLLAAKAYANQPQFWKDFKTIFNSDYLRERRGGNQINVNENELAQAAEKGGIQGTISLLLNKGFIFTKIADSFAIASGGAPMYRNRINTYVKQGLSQKEAEDKAFLDFKAITEETQQSSRPDRISEQQASNAGRLLLAFANTPMQYNRIIKRNAQDLVDGRGDPKEKVTKIIYYSTIQNLLFNAMQKALFALAFAGEDEDEKEIEKYSQVASGMADSLLRGSGLTGNAVVAVKNIAFDIADRAKRPRPNFQDAAWKALTISPPLHNKASKLRGAGYSLGYVTPENVFEPKLDNPALSAGANIISAATNVPLDRALRKAQNIEAAMSDEAEWWQRTALLMGWGTWELGMENEKDKKEKQVRDANIRASNRKPIKREKRRKTF